MTGKLRESLILGSLLALFARAWSGLCSTRAAAWFGRACDWFNAQWHESVLVRWFCSPGYLDRENRLAGNVLALLRKGYEMTRLGRMIAGSVFLRSFFWCALCLALCPILPTMAVLGLAIVGCFSALLRLVHMPVKRPALTVLLPVGGYLVFYCIGTLHSADLGSSLYTAVLMVFFVLFSVLSFYSVESRRQLDRLILSLVSVGALVSAYGIVQYVFKLGYQSEAWVDNDMFSTIQFRASSTLQNPNMLGEYLVLLLPLGAAQLLRPGDWRLRLWYFVCCGLMGVCIILTFSRGAWLGLLLAAVLFALLLKPRLLFLVPVALVLLILLMPETVISRFTSIGDLGDHSTSYRVSIWLGTIRMLRDGHWLLGIGPGEDAFNRFYPYYAMEAITAPHSHNLYLQMICDGGIFTLLAFAWVLVRYVRTLCGRLFRETDRESRILQAACVSGALGFLLQAMTDYSFYNYRMALLFWGYLMIGLLCAGRQQLRNGDENDSSLEHHQ